MMFSLSGADTSVTHEALVSNLAEEQRAFCLCCIQQALVQDEQLARLRVDLHVDGVLIEAIGCKAVDFGRPHRINPHGVLQRVLGLVFELGRDSNHVDAPQRRLNRLLAIGLK
jgi:hypothetical protein